MQKRSHKMHPLVIVLDLRRKKCMLKWPRSELKIKFISEIVKGKKIHSSFVVVPQPTSYSHGAVRWKRH